MKTIKDTLAGIYDDPALRSNIIPLFLGNPGLGKTVLIKEFAKERGVQVVDFIASQRNPFEISGMAIPDRDLKKMDIWDFDTLLQMKDGDILFFDEVLNGNPAVLNACLTLLENRETISGKKLADILIVAAANPQGMAVLTPQIKERFVWYDMVYSPVLWQEYMSRKYGMPESVSRQLSTLIREEDFTGRNFNTPRSLDKAVDMVIKGVNTPYKSLIGIILETLITNTTGQKVQLTKDKVLEPDEKISWLKLINYKNSNKNEETKEQEV